MKINKDFTDIGIFIINTLMFVLVVFLMLVLILFVTACTTTKTEYVDKIVEVKVPVPQKCDFYLYPKPDINTSTMQSVYDSVTELALDGIQIRKEIDITPCLKVIYKEKK